MSADVAQEARGLTPPVAVLFDWDNTLVDNWNTIHGALNAARRAFGMPPWSFEEAMLRIRKSARDSFPEMFGQDWEAAQKIFYDTFAETHLQSLSVKPGAVELLSRLARAAKYLGVVSNKRGDLLRKEAEHLGWTGYFGRLVGAGDADRDKPEPDPIHLALRNSGHTVGPAVWYVGDAAIDMQCALAAGCTPVLVGPGKGEEELLRKFAPSARVARLSDLADLAQAS
jgi:phosphoglycolate phosphatase